MSKDTLSILERELKNRFPDQYLSIWYPLSPVDPLFLANPREITARATYYGIDNISNSVLAGNIYNNSTISLLSDNVDELSDEIAIDTARFEPARFALSTQVDDTDSLLHIGVEALTTLLDYRRVDIHIALVENRSGSDTSIFSRFFRCDSCYFWNAFPNKTIDISPVWRAEDRYKEGIEGPNNLLGAVCEYDTLLTNLKLMIWVQDVETKYVYQVIEQPLNGLTQFLDCASLEESNRIGFPSQGQLFPNPTSTNLTLRLESPLESQATAQLLDPTGRILHQATLPPETQQWDFDLSSFPRGVYLLQLETPQGIFLQEKIIKSP